MEVLSPSGPTFCGTTMNPGLQMWMYVRLPGYWVLYSRKQSLPIPSF